MDRSVACRTCRSNQLLSACCRGAFLAGPAGPAGTGTAPRNGMDLISALPDDLILQCLIRLCCARAAAHTSLLSRRWRGLWTRLPELTFHNIAPDPLDAALALALAASPALSLLVIHVSGHHSFTSARVSSLIHDAARLAPAELSVDISGHVPSGIANAVVELPSFHRSTSVCLRMSEVCFALPPAGDFPVLECLSLSSCHIDLADLLPRCPKLRKLCIRSWGGPSTSITVHSPTLEELEVYHYGQIQRIDILTPLLKKLRFHAFSNRENEFSLSYSAPMVEELSWECFYFFGIGFGPIWNLDSLILETPEPVGRRQLANNREITCLQPQRYLPVHVLRLDIGLSHILTDPVRSIKQEISQFLVVSSFSSLELKIMRPGHVYGPVVLHVLGVSTFIQRLKVELCKVEEEEEETCSVNCPCDLPNNWRSQSISLTHLKEVEIKGFRGRNHEVDLLKVIFKSATMLRRMALHLSNEASSRSIGCKEVHRLSKANPSVECNIYHESGEQVLYA